MFKNLNIAIKIISLIVVMALGMALIGFTGFYFTQKANVNMTKIYKDYLLPIKWINSVRVNIRAGEAITVQLILLNNDKSKEQEFNQQFAKLKDENDKIMTNYEKANLDPYDSTRISQIKEALNSYRAERQKALDLASAGQKLAAYEYYRTHAIPNLTIMNKAGDEIAEYDAKTADEINNQNNLDFIFANKILIFLPLICIVLALGLGWWVAKIISKPLAAVVANLQEISNGNLTTQKIKFNSNDEVGQLIKAENKMTENLRMLIENISRTTEQLASSSEQLTASAEQSAQAATQVASTIAEVANGAENQSKAIDITSASINKISNGIQHTANNAKAAADTSNETSTAAKEGQAAIESAIVQMSSIEKTVNSAAKMVTKLGERSKEIGRIVDTITGIAGQTNLLALNAAIEAARAGEQGRGFAVVAEEVRKLAEQSQEAAKQIATLIESIQADTEKAVVSMNTGTVEVGKGADVVNTAGKSFENIAKLINNVSKDVIDMSMTMQEIANETQQVVSSVQGIDTISRNAIGHTQTVSAATEEQSASMEQIAANSQSLANMAEELQTSIQKFKI